MSVSQEIDCINLNSGKKRTTVNGKENHCVIDFAGDCLLREVGAVPGHAWHLGHRLAPHGL